MSSNQPEDEPSELARFRAEWKAELESRKRQAAEPSSTSIPEETKPFVHNRIPTTSSKVPGPSQLPIAHPAITSDGKVIDQGKTKILGNALAIYHQAVQHEQLGELDDALALYRQAFRLDSHVDRAYFREEMLLSIATQQRAGIKKPTHNVPLNIISLGSTGKELDDMTTSMQKLSVKTEIVKTKKAVVTGDLVDIVSSFLNQEEPLAFSPEDEKEPLFINNIPEELLTEVLKLLDHTSIERFAQVCKKARVLTLDSSIWRHLVLSTYKEPQLDIEALTEVIHQYLFDYRRVYIEQPRIRTDGVYISICHYVRPGLSENHWVNVSHLVTYYRYLRFFPDGQVFCLRTNEEQSPQNVIKILKLTLRMKGLSIGTWSLSGTTVLLSNLVEASTLSHYPIPDSFGVGITSSDIGIGGIPIDRGIPGKFEAPSSIPGRFQSEIPPPIPSSSSGAHTHTQSQTHVHAQTRYVYLISLNFKSKPLGRWNKLEIDAFDTVNIETGDVVPVGLKHERPFWFSKVRSYE